MSLAIFQLIPFITGISSAQDEYQACMEKILGDMEFVVVFLDVILVLSVSEEEYLEHLRIVFERLTKYGQRSAVRSATFCERRSTTRVPISVEDVTATGEEDPDDPENRRTTQPQGAPTLPGNG
ncbi:hypothetical protein PC116_g6030 [Phytophthora cactorum]|nr:hypothetical protein Pcac1_g16909 [Phytophthora cactorum]KAG4246213.1 hypothetical protein PC116_g6030 [Phytophthora cactorum]